MTLRLPDRTGAAKMALGLARSLRADGFDLTLFHGATPSQQPNILPDFSEIGARTVLEPRLEHPGDPRLVRSMAALVRRDEGACMVGVNQRDRMPALLTAARVGVPCVLLVQNQHHFWGPRLVSVLKERSYAAAVSRWTTLAVCPSTVVRDEITNFGVPTDRTVVLPNGIEVKAPAVLDAGEREQLRNEMGATADELLLLNVGRLNPQKGHDVLLEALGGSDVASRIHIAFVGSAWDPTSSRTNEYEASLHRQVEELDLAGVVTFMGWRDDIGRLLAAADGYAHSARWEGPALPLAVMEAMAAGRATVFTDCSGDPPGFRDRHHGLIARTGDPTSLRERINELVAMSDAQREAMGAAGAALIDAHYRVEYFGREVTGRIRELVERHAP